MNTRTLHLRPQVALTCFAFLSWFSGIVIIQQATRIFLAISLARVASPLWVHSSGLWKAISAFGGISLAGGGLEQKQNNFSWHYLWDNEKLCLMFRSSHFSLLFFGHFWRRSYEPTKILHNLCLHFARQDGQDGKNGEKIMQLKWPKDQKSKDENMGCLKH